MISIAPAGNLAVAISIAALLLGNIMVGPQAGIIFGPTDRAIAKLPSTFL